MNNLKRPFITFVSILAMMASTPSFAAQTDWHSIARIQITDSGGGVMYLRPLGYGAWGGDDCPNALHVYVAKPETPAFDNYIALALSSQLNGGQVKFFGTCNAAGTYLKFHYMLLQD